MHETIDSMRKQPIEALSRDLLLMLRRTVAAADLAEMIGVVCSNVDSVVAADCGVVLFRLERCMPDAVIWPRTITGRDADYALYFQSVSPALPFDCERDRNPVTWTRPRINSSSEAVPAWAVLGPSAGIGLTDRVSRSRYFLTLHRDGRSAPFSSRDGTLLKVISVFVSRMLTLRSLADQREGECLHDRETERSGAVPGAVDVPLKDLLRRRASSREKLIQEIAGEPR